jgi:hypothetical protein
MAISRWDARTLNLHPGVNGERPVVTWTAPAAGNYRIAGYFQVVDKQATGVEVIVKSGGAVLTDKMIARYGDTVTFDKKFKVQAGQQVSFSVDAHGAYQNDSTELKAAVLQLNLGDRPAEGPASRALSTFAHLTWNGRA